MPASTSPDPAVDIHAGARPERITRSLPSPSVPTTMVTAPFNNTVAPVSSWTLRAQASGCERTLSTLASFPSSRVNMRASSPTCGVTTT